MAEFLKKVVFTTDMNADSVEWCPITNYRHLFVCGTYQLATLENCKGEDEKDPLELRKGHLHLFGLVKKPEVIKQLQKIPMVGILDSKWAHRKLSDNIYLAVATAIGEVHVFKLKDEPKIKLHHVHTHKLCSNPSILALSLDWSTGLYDSDVKIIIGDSEGFITQASFAEGQISEDCKWKLHDFQAWTVAFNYWDPQIFFSGGDDNFLFIYDRRLNKVHKNDQTHTAGITSMHMNSKKQHTLITGSYDEKVAFWDVRRMDQPTHTLNTGGGVWRLKWEPQDCEDIAAACMHNGFAALDGVNHTVLAEYKEHTSLGYGIDWCHLDQADLRNFFNFDYKTDKKVHLLAMCSFYDNLMSLALLERDK